jgi:hypothetical protein
MKSFFFTTVLSLLFTFANAQNFQSHYDFGKDRAMLTTTFEMFKVDDYGNTYFFIDFDHGGKAAGVQGVSLSYFELAREFQFWDNPFAVHAEYNSGMFRTEDFAAPINSAFLFGGSYTFANVDFSSVYKVVMLYKHIDEKPKASFQFTTVWEFHLLENKVSLTGFTDLWNEENIVFDDNGIPSEAKFVFISEPQLWYNFTKHFSLGGEVELSSNFAGHKGFMANPTLAFKWTF